MERLLIEVSNGRDTQYFLRSFDQLCYCHLYLPLAFSHNKLESRLGPGSSDVAVQSRW